MKGYSYTNICKKSGTFKQIVWEVSTL